VVERQVAAREDWLRDVFAWALWKCWGGNERTGKAGNFALSRSVTGLPVRATSSGFDRCNRSAAS
jgi:hypothetical protein